MAPLLPLALQPTHAHLEGTLLPRGFFLVLGLIYLAALAVDRLAERLRRPSCCWAWPSVGGWRGSTT